MHPGDAARLERRGDGRRRRSSAIRCSGITIQDLGQDAAGATLQVTMPRDTVPPAPSGGLTAVAAGTSARPALDGRRPTTSRSTDYVVDARRRRRSATPATTDFTRHAASCRARRSPTPSPPSTRPATSGPAAAVSLTIPDTTPPGAPPRVTATADEGRQGARRLGRRDRQRPRRGLPHPPRNGKVIATGPPRRTYVDKAPQPGQRLDRHVLGRRLRPRPATPAPRASARPLRAALHAQARRPRN